LSSVKFADFEKTGKKALALWDARKALTGKMFS
jgi:hypothetical protein